MTGAFLYTVIIAAYFLNFLFLRTYKLGEEGANIPIFMESLLNVYWTCSFDSLRTAAALCVSILLMLKIALMMVTVDLGISIRLKYGFLLKVCKNIIIQD
jgi:hypothetical protein